MMDFKVSLLGKLSTIHLPNGDQHRGQFAIVDLDRIKASHNEQTFADTPGYPTNADGRNVNDRNYSGDPNAQALVEEYARNLEPGLLISTGRTPEGTPIINEAGFVVSGNNRTMSAKLARTKYPASYRLYKDFLGEELEAFGINVDEYNKRISSATNAAPRIKHPFLVRIDFEAPVLTTEVLAKYNQASTKSERPVDKTVKLSNILRENASCGQQIPKLFEDDDTMSEFYADTNAQKQLLDMLLACNLLTRQQVPEYYNDGYFTEAGKHFVEMTLAAIILRPEALQAAQMDGVVSLRKAIVNALPVLMDNIALQTPGAGLVEAINEAVVFQQKMKASKLPFADFLAQKNLLDAVTYSCEMLALNRLMNTGQRAFKSAIARYNETLKANAGESLFGETQKVSPGEAFEKIILEALDGPEKRLVQQYCSNLERESAGPDAPKAGANHEAAFEQKVTEAFEAGKKLNVTNLRKLAKEAGIEAGNEKYIWELTELAWTKWYRHLTAREGPPARKFNAVTVFYENVQPTYTGVDSHKKVFQQYSTSAPIAWLAGWFTDTGNVRSVLEPSAGNGLLTIYYPENRVVANDLDPVRYQNLLKQPFKQVLNRDASEPFPANFHRAFDAVLTNPPFGRLPDVNREFGLPFKAIDHVMVAHALDCMKDDGRAALIIGGHTEVNRDGQIASHRPFFNWMYRHYRVLALLNVNARKLYHKQGTDFPLRLILVAGRKVEPYGGAPIAGNAGLGLAEISAFDELYRAVDFFRRKADEQEETLTQKINREHEKVKIELA